MKDLIIKLTPNFLHEIVDRQLTRPFNMECTLLYIGTLILSSITTILGIPMLQILADGWFLKILLIVLSGTGTIILSVISYIVVQTIGVWSVNKIRARWFKHIKCKKKKIKESELAKLNIKSDGDLKRNLQ